jgi:hypothetical protein
MKTMRSLWMVIALCFFCAANAGAAETAKDAWAALVGKRFIKRPGFPFVKNDPKLPNIFIYGDSISIGYTPQVQSSLKGKANVYRLYCNGGDSSSLIPKMTKMSELMRDNKLEGHWNFEWNIIHFNVGLHDLKYVAGGGKLDKKNGKQVSSTERYAKNVSNVAAYLKKTAPRATLIFATTTPVPEGEPGRVAGDAKKYNAVALDALKAHPEISVNDLYAFTKPNQPKWWTRPGNVHFGTEGRKAQGNEVARVLLNALKAK